MDEIVQAVVDRTGIPADKARMAVQVVASQLQQRLPAPIASQVTSYLGGGSATGTEGGAAGGGLGDAAKGLGGLFNK